MPHLDQSEEVSRQQVLRQFAYYFMWSQTKKGSWHPQKSMHPADSSCLELEVFLPSPPKGAFDQRNNFFMSVLHRCSSRNNKAASWSTPNHFHYLLWQRRCDSRIRISFSERYFLLGLMQAGLKKKKQNKKKHQFRLPKNAQILYPISGLSFIHFKNHKY